MKLSELITRCKIKIPNLKISGINDDDLTVIINEGVREVNLLTQVYRGYTDFNVVANKQSYSLAIIAPTFLQIVTAGLWVCTSGLPADLKRVIPRTEEWLNKRTPNWRAASAATLPQYYYQSGDDLVMYPAMNAAITTGGRIHHTLVPTPMSNGNHYPFSGTTTQITQLLPLDKAIVEYVRKELAPTFNEKTGEDISEKRFYAQCLLAKRQVKARPDAINYYDTAVSVQT